MTTSARLTALLVGGFFRPPAKALLAHLPGGAELQLVPEPENPYDPDAIKVCFDGVGFPMPASYEAENDLQLQGFSAQEIVDASELWQLGYIARTGGKPLAGKPWSGNAEVLQMLNQPGAFARATLGFGPAGEYLVTIEALPISE